MCVCSCVYSCVCVCGGGSDVHACIRGCVRVYGCSHFLASGSGCPAPRMLLPTAACRGCTTSYPILTVDARGGVVLDAQVDVLVDAKACAAGGAERRRGVGGVSRAPKRRVLASTGCRPLTSRITRAASAFGHDTARAPWAPLQ